MGLWVIGYGIVQGSAPSLRRAWGQTAAPGVAAVRFWSSVLTAVPALIAIALWRQVGHPGIAVVAGLALFAVMRARPELGQPGARVEGSMLAQMLSVLKRRWALTVIIVVALEGGAFWGAFTFVGADLHQRFGLGFAAVGLAVAALDRKSTRLNSSH